MKIRFSSFFALFLLLVGINPLLADGISVNAGISRPEVNSGDMAELQIKVSGAQQADVPQQIAVEGLNIRADGQFQGHFLSRVQLYRDAPAHR